MKTPRWTYSSYRAALRLDGKTVALLTSDGVSAFENGQVQPLLDLLNDNLERADQLAKNLLSYWPDAKSII